MKSRRKENQKLKIKEKKEEKLYYKTEAEETKKKKLHWNKNKWSTVVTNAIELQKDGSIKFWNSSIGNGFNNNTNKLKLKWRDILIFVGILFESCFSCLSFSWWVFLLLPFFFCFCDQIFVFRDFNLKQFSF